MQGNFQYNSNVDEHIFLNRIKANLIFYV